VASACSDDDVAIFMLAVEPGAFIGCNGWDAQNFGKPLGAPLGPYRRFANGTYFREFKSGTTVAWDPSAEKGGRARIQWAGDPPLPPLPPPAPAPPPRPPGACSEPEMDCGWRHDDAGTTHAHNWTECCGACRAEGACAKWVFWPSASAGAGDR
jgi:hypothetical protein